MTLSALPAPNFTGADLSARLNAVLTEGRAARRFPSVDALLADTTLAYGNGNRAVAVGDRITTADGHLYEAAAANASNHHVATAGGVRLYVQPNQGAYSVMAFGAKGDNATDDTAAIQAAIRAAIAGRVHRIVLESGHRVTDLDLTRLHYCGLILEGANLTHQPAGTATVIVTGAASQGFDISGTSGVVFRNISIRGDAAAPPRCGLFAQRVSGSQESYGHVFENLRTYGSFTDAAIYNFAGEMWEFQNCILWSEGGGGRAGYFTTTNSLGRTTKFRTPDGTVTPLTITSFRKCDIKGTGIEAIWFEQQAATAGDRTIQNILFDGCYTRARGGATSVLRFTDIFGGVTLNACTDESFATNDPSAAATIIRIDSARALRGLSIRNCAFYPRLFVVDATAPVQDYDAAANWVSPGTGGNWRFATLANATHRTLFESESFAVTSSASMVDVMPANRAALSKIMLPANRMGQAFDWLHWGDPTGSLNPERRNVSVLNGFDNSLWVPVGTATGVDSFSWRRVMTIEARSSLPTSGTYGTGFIIWRNTPTPGGKMGWVCTDSGTFGTLTGVTATTTSGSATATVSDASGLARGQFITIAGVTGRRQIINISGTTVTLNSPANASVSAAAVAYQAPTFREWGAIDP